MVLSRRGFVYGSGAAAVIAAFGPSFLQAASAAPTLTGKDLEKLRERWVDSLTGRRFIPAEPATFTSAIASLDRKVTNLMANVSPTQTRFFSQHDWAVGSSENSKSNSMRMNYVDLQTMAIAWATPTSIHENSDAVLDVLRRGLAHMHERIYNKDTLWWGNWWSWNIGATRPLADMMAILHAELDQDAIDDYCAAIDHFLPERDPRLQLIQGGSQTSDGANRVDICRAIIIRSIVQPDTALLTKSVEALSPTWQYVTEGNGFFRDGSFVQHSTIGYTGTYGLVLLGGLSRLFGLLAGTAFDITDESRENLIAVIEGSFAPLMYNGQMMDAVRGRAICRPEERSIDNGNQLIEYTLRLADAADAKTANRWRGLCKQWIESNDAETVTKSTDITRLALVTELMTSDVEAAPVASGPRMFPAMDRLVHRGEGNTWALCTAMCSNRIAWSEGTPQENFLSFKTSQGMTYVYLSDDDDHFDDEYWATCDLEAPVGTTVDMTPLKKNPEGTWGNATPENEWTGGAQLGTTAVAGMHLVAPGGTGLVARKTWFTTPDMIIALGADIATESSAEVRTVVEHRNLGTGVRELVVDGDPVISPEHFASPTWAHLTGVGGYLFLDESSDISAGVAEREGAWERNNTNATDGADVVHRRNYATLAYHHGEGAAVRSATYAYALLPKATPEETKRLAAAPSVTILTNDSATQSANLPGGATGATFWKPGSAGGFTSDSSLCLLARPVKDTLEMTLSDPTQQQDTVRLVIAGMDTHHISGRDADRVSFEMDEGDTQLVIDTSNSAGLSLLFTLEGAPEVTPSPSVTTSAPPTAPTSPPATQSPVPTAAPSSTKRPTTLPTTSTPGTPGPTPHRPTKRPGLPSTGV